MTHPSASLDSPNPSFETSPASETGPASPDSPNPSSETETGSASPDSNPDSDPLAKEVMDYPPETGFASPDLDFHSSETGPVSPDPNPDSDLPANEIMDPDADLPANEIMAKKRPRWKGIPETCYDTDSRDLLQKADPVRKQPKAKDHIKLPEKYEMLGEFFDCLESSIRLV